jgi:predicted permease
MIFIGISVAESNEGRLSDIFKKKLSFWISFIKLIILPAAAFLFFYAIGLLGAGMDKFVITIVVLELAMPCATIIPVIADQYGSDQRFATENVVYSTIFSMITLPAALYLINTFLG